MGIEHFRKKDSHNNENTTVKHIHFRMPGFIRNEGDLEPCSYNKKRPYKEHFINRHNSRGRYSNSKRKALSTKHIKNNPKYY